jgi:hypothetical protein
LRDWSGKFEGRGAHLAVVGSGASGFIPPFRETTKFTGPIYSDPTRKAYDAAGLVRGVTTVLDPRAALALVRALKGGFCNGRTQGDPWQQGGVFVIRPGGEVTYRYESRYAGDHPDPQAILAALS